MLQYVCLATIRYITATFLSSMVNVNRRWRHLVDTLISTWQNVNKQRDWSRRAYDQWRFLMNRWFGELQDLSLQNERFTWARVSQTKTRWIYIYQFSQERSDWQQRAVSTWDVTLPERVATEGSHNTLTWGEQRVSTRAVNKQIYLFI